LTSQGLAPGHLDGPGQRLLGEGLAGIRGVLSIQLAHLVGREVAQAQRLQLDVEGARCAEAPGVAAGGRLVVAHVAQAAEDHRGGELLRPVGKARPELPQHRHQAGVAERVDLVEEQHDRPRAGAGPGFEHGVEAVARSSVGERRRTELRGERRVGLIAHSRQHDALGSLEVIARRLPGLARQEHRRVAARGQQLARQRPQRRRLSRLPGGVHHEVTELLDQVRGLGEAALRRDHVMHRGDARAGRIEATLHANDHDPIGPPAASKARHQTNSAATAGGGDALRSATLRSAGARPAESRGSRGRRRGEHGRCRLHGRQR